MIVDKSEIKDSLNNITINNIASKFNSYVPVIIQCSKENLKYYDYDTLDVFFQVFDWISFADPAAVAASQANKEETDARSVFVGNVRISLFLIFYSFSFRTTVLF